MNDKVLVAKLVDFYWEIDETIEGLAGRVGSEEITEIKDLQLKLDVILTNSSKRWAKGLREPKPVQERVNTLY